ncbi:MAG: methyltransferase domain-containing protein [Candidatus Eisenbacteria bacterium]
MSQPREWDADTYHRVSAPQHGWGLRVLERLALRGGEHVLDAGCGTGRVTLALCERVQAAGGRVSALDGSVRMTQVARRTLPVSVPVVAANLLAMPYGAAFDVVFSTATFHWVRDPAALYAALARVLRPGGRLVAQCGGAGNLRAFLERVHVLCGLPRFAARFADWREPYCFLAAPAAAAYLRAGGFTEVRAGLEPAPATFDRREDYRVFLERVVLGAWMTRFDGAEPEREAFLDVLCDAAEDDATPFTLDYVRLNLEAALPPETA